MDKNGSVGFGITPDGDIEAVFDNANNYRTHRIVEIDISPVEIDNETGKNVTPQRPSDQLFRTGLSSEAYADTSVPNDTITRGDGDVKADGRDMGMSRAEVEREISFVSICFTNEHFLKKCVIL